jgi:excisionase family DNA binding protein
MAEHSLKAKKEGIDSDALLTVRQCAKLIGVSERTISNWVSSKKLPAFKIKHVIRFRREAVQAFIDSNSEPIQ